MTCNPRHRATAPSGANLQPWRFVVVSDPERKRRLRVGTEQQERAFYGSRASAEWLAALAPLGTDWRKPFLETAPHVIVVFEVHKGPRSPVPTTPGNRSGSRSDCCSPCSITPVWPP
jgi:iodotyrosine deiodinase